MLALAVQVTAPPVSPSELFPETESRDSSSYTVTRQESVLPLAVRAVMVAVPAFRQLSAQVHRSSDSRSALWTATTRGSLLVKAMSLAVPRGRLAARAVAAPVSRFFSSASRVTDCGSPFPLTVMAQVWLLLLYVATVITAEPSEIAVTRPVLSTRATFPSLLEKLYAPALVEGDSVTRSCKVSSTVRLAERVLRVIIDGEGLTATAQLADTPVCVLALITVVPVFKPLIWPELSTGATEDLLLE